MPRMNNTTLTPPTTSTSLLSPFSLVGTTQYRKAPPCLTASVNADTPAIQQGDAGTHNTAQFASPDVSGSIERTSRMKTIDKFDLVDHGIEHSQCFQGCGLTPTDFDNIAIGIGDNPAEAIDDCLEQMAQAGFKTEGMEMRIMKQEYWVVIPETPSVIRECDVTHENCKLHYHISIRWNEAKPS